jgi:hypothetical protein
MTFTMKRLVPAVLFFVAALATTTATAQTVLDDFNRAKTTNLDGSRRWRKLHDLTDPSATMQINADSTISPLNPLGPFNRGGVFWDSALTGRFQVGIVLKHKSGSDNISVFHLQLMDDSSWFTGKGYGLRFAENAGSDRYDIQLITGSGADTPYVDLLANFNREFSAGDTLFFKFYEDGLKSAVRYGGDGSRDSISVVDTTYRPAGWYPWIQGRVFTDSVRLDDFMVGPIPYRITASAGAGGAISPGGIVLVDPGASRSFTFLPDPGFGVAGVLVDGAPIGAPSAYTFYGVSADHTIQAFFDTLRYTVTASAGLHGSINPSGPLTVNYGLDASFTISPDPGCHLDSLVVDDIAVDSTISYTFSGVTADHTIAAYFSFNVYVISATAGPHGTISPSGSVAATHGSDRSFTVLPDPGYVVDTLRVDGSTVDSTTGYTFTNVTAPHTIGVTFKSNPVVTSAYPLRANWNIVSVPLDANDRSPGALFPSASGNAYGYNGGYETSDTLSTGRGYWIKFPAEDSATITGRLIAAETVDVDEGWNMVGSVSTPLPVANVTTIPPGLTGSGFFGYAGGYALTQTVQPGLGYWVKMNGPGRLVLSGDAPANHPSAMRIVPTGELPPPPPGPPVADAPADVPAAYALGQNYPNPFNPSTRIDFDLPAASQVRLTVFNVLGEEVMRLVDGVEPAGRKSVTFDAGELPAGIYICRLVAGDYVGQAKMLLLK